MSQKSILSFFKSPSGNVKKICDKELHTKKLSLKNIPAAESPEKDIGFRSIKKARQIIESDEEICEEPFLDDKSPECMLAENGKQSINDQSQNENDPLENDAGDPPEGIVCKTTMKWGERSDNDKSKIDKIYDKSDVFSECTLKMNVVDATVETKEMKDNRTKAQQLYEDDVTCKNDETFNENSVLKRKRCVNISNQNKTLRREKTKLETQTEVQEQLISEKDINASHYKEQSNSKKKIVKKRKNFESKKTSNENVCKKQRQVKIIGKKDKKIKSHTKNYSSENESDPNDTSVSVSHGVKADDSPEVKRMEKDDVSNESSQFHRFFTNHKGQKDKFSRTLKKIVSQEIEEEKPCSSAQKVDTDYQPCKSHYHPIDDACWKRDEKVPYLALAKTMESMENISGRLKIIEILSNFLRSVIVLTPDDLLYSVYLCLNKLAPEYMGIEMGVGETLLMKAVAQATGRTVDKIKTEVNLKGDLGLVAENCRGNQRVMFAPPKLTVSSVFLKFREIAQMSGNAAMTKKVDKIQALFVACRLCEAKYIIRSLSGKLRIGLAEQSVLAALAQAAILTPPNQAYPPKVLNASLNMSADAFKKKVENQSLILKSTYCECPNYDMMIPILLKEGIEGLPKHCHLTPGIPLKPMLAHPTKGIDEVLRRFDNNEFTCEFKYDGERAQIHVMDGCEVKIYSRNQEDNTSKYPDVVSRFTKALKSNTKSCILDSEAVAWNHEDKQILPFQVLSTRKKKDAVKSEIVVQVCIVAFDLLYLNGESLVKHPLKERRRLLYEHFNEVENEFLFVKSMDGNSEEIMQDFLNESIKGNCEGLMVKSLEVDASYEIAKRSHNWLKLKKDYLDGVGDTLDLVVIGGFHGKGKRCGGYGGFLLACYDDENEEFQSICKIGTGIKEEEFESHTSFFKQHVIVDHKQYYRFDNSLKPDAWFEPVQVWEVKCADLSISPVHKAAVGLVDPEKGISLRFPRFLRIRDDKKSEEATTSTEVARMYSNQEQVQNQKCKAPKLEDEDFY